MEKELEVVKIDDKDYAIIHEIEKDGKTFLYMSNVEDENDNMIRKIEPNNKDLILPLENDQEFELACGLLMKLITKK